MKKIRFLIIGVGYHARRIYIPYVVDKNDTELSALYDLDSQKKVIEDYLINKKLSISAYYTNNSEISDTLTKEEVESLNNIIKEKNINAVIISTEPLAHFKYAKWAIDSDLHIVMDKPITTEIDISTKNIKAKKLYEDYLKLKKLYKKKKNKLVFILQAQRRFHVGYQKVRDLILETSNKTNCPVTSMEVFHSDGMWRLPKEIIDMDYHPYNQGYGKVSHSGYHSIDIALWFVKASIISPEKKVNEIEVYSSFLRPVDFFKQITYKDYKKIFPNDDDSLLLNDKELLESSQLLKTSVTGEIDAHSIISLKKDGGIITQIGSHLVHNGFSQRGWFNSNYKDLYKGNGRLRHESYIIEQGPFQCVIINAFQSLEIKNELTNPYSVGGEHHFDIHIFRNNSLFPEYQAYELITMQDLKEVQNTGHSRGHQEEARRNCVDEFIKAIVNKVPISKQESNFLSHELGTFILSNIYKSAANSYQKKNSVIKSKLPKDLWKI